MSDRRRFHLAFPVDDLEKARRFYGGLLGCPTGRENGRWIDFDFFGNQITAHLAPMREEPPVNPVDGDKVPARHFGAILEWNEWQDLAGRFEAAGIEFLIAPKVRFGGKPGEQGTFFLADPAGNYLEFKSFRDESMIFAEGRGHDFA